MVDDDGGVREGVPGEGRVVARCLFGDGDQRGERGGGPAGVSQGPPGVMAGGQPQFRVCCYRERPGGEVLNPVRLAGGNGGRSGRHQPPRLVPGGGAELGRAFHRQRGGGRTAATLRLGGRGLEQRCHPLVRSQRGGRQVPRSPVGPVAQRVGELAVRRRALREGRGMVDGGPDQWMGELQAAAADRDEAELLGRREGPRVGPAASPGGRAQVRAVGHGRQHQCRSRPLGQGGEPGCDDGPQPVGQGQRLGDPPAAGGGIVRDHPRQLDQRHRITDGLAEHLRPHVSARRARLLVQQAAGVRGGERLKPQLRESPVEARGRSLSPGADKHHQPLRVKAAAGERQRLQRAAVEPVSVVDDQEHRGTLGKIRQQGQQANPGQERVGGSRVGVKTEGPKQRPCLPAGKARDAGQHRPQELMQPGEREPRLRLPAGDRQHPRSRRPGPLGRVCQQRGLAHAGLTDHQQHLAHWRGRINQSAQLSTLGSPADDVIGPL